MDADFSVLFDLSTPPNLLKEKKSKFEAKIRQNTIAQMNTVEEEWLTKVEVRPECGHFSLCGVKGLKYKLLLNCFEQVLQIIERCRRNTSTSTQATILEQILHVFLIESRD